MAKIRRWVRWIVVATGIVVIAGFVALLFIRAALLSQYDLLDNDTGRRLIYIALFPIAMAVLWLGYKGAFVGETYTDQERRAIAQQLWTFAATLGLLLTFALTQQVFALVLVGLTLGFAGLNAIAARVSLIALRLLGGARNKGLSAVVVGVLELALAIYLLYFSVNALVS